MAKKRDRPVACRNCKAALPAGHHGPCPNCGDQLTFTAGGAHSERFFKESLESNTRRGFYEGHKSIAILMIVIIFTFPIIGVFVRGVSGLLLGVVTSVLSYYLLPYAALTVRRIRGIE